MKLIRGLVDIVKVLWLIIILILSIVWELFPTTCAHCGRFPRWDWCDDCGEWNPRF